MIAKPVEAAKRDSINAEVPVRVNYYLRLSVPRSALPLFIGCCHNFWTFPPLLCCVSGKFLHADRISTRLLRSEVVQLSMIAPGPSQSRDLSVSVLLFLRYIRLSK